MDHQSYDPILRYPPNKPLNMIPGCATFPLLEPILDPVRTPLRSLQDAILVSIDLEYTYSQRLGKNCITQIGTATLDTRTLSFIDINNPQALKTAIQCRCFNLYPSQVPTKRRTPKFLWGTLEDINRDEARIKLKQVLHDTRDSSDIPPRNIVLVGHAIRSDRSVLIDTIGFDIKYVPSVRAILDTGRMMCCAYDFGVASHSHYSLRFMLRYLGVHYDQLHNAGNDAMFTMKALLLMFANWKHQKGQHMWNILDEATLGVSNSAQLASDDRTKEQLLWGMQIEVLTAIAREPWPVTRKHVTHCSMMNGNPVKACQNDPPGIEDLGLEDLFELMEQPGCPKSSDHAPLRQMWLGIQERSSQVNPLKI